jgi:hypothetical protein
MNTDAVTPQFTDVFGLAGKYWGMIVSFTLVFSILFLMASFIVLGSLLPI